MALDISRLLLLLALSTSAAALEKISWSEGGKTRRAWLDPELIAEFHSSGENSGVTRNIREARRLPESAGSVGIWKLGKGDSFEAAHRSLVKAQPGGSFSPVFRDFPAARGPLRALPGNVLVRLPAAWNKDQVAAWALENKIELLRKLGTEGNFHLVKSAPGFAALELSRTLAAAPGVEAAFPDWWESTTKK